MVARQAHNLKAGGSNPSPATRKSGRPKGLLFFVCFFQKCLPVSFPLFLTGLFIFSFFFEKRKKNSSQKKIKKRRRISGISPAICFFFRLTCPLLSPIEEGDRSRSGMGTDGGSYPIDQDLSVPLRKIGLDFVFDRKSHVPAVTL